MCKVPGRELWKALARCPICGRVLKVRLSRQEKRNWIGPNIFTKDERERYTYRVHELPVHKVYVSDPERLNKVVLSGKAPNEHPWCRGGSFNNNRDVLFTPNKPGTESYRRCWEFVRWR